MSRLAVLLLVLPTTAWADDDTDDTDTLVGDEVIVVTGTRSDTPRSSSPVTTEVIDRSQIEASGAQSVAEVLALRPGLWVDRGVAGTNGVTMQGLGPEYTLVTIDGARQIGRTDGVLDLDRFGLEDIEQIEVVRGPSSVLYGSDALGGVINLVTRPPKDGVHVDAMSRIDGRLASDTRARVAVGHAGIAGVVVGEYKQADAIRLDPTSEGTSIDAYEDRHATAHAIDQRTAGWRFDANGDYLWRDLRGISALPTGAVFDQRNLVETASGGGIAAYSGAKTSVRIAADASIYRDQYLSDQRSSDALDQYQETREHLYEGSLQVGRLFGDHHRAMAGAEVLRETLSSDRLAKPGGRTRTAVFAQDEWSATSEILVVPAARIDIDTQFGVHATPRVAARYEDVKRGFTVRGSVGMGYRAPGFKELLIRFSNPGAGYVVDGNPDLKPETSFSVQAGAEWKAKPWLWLSAEAYDNELRDLIYPSSLGTDAGGTLQFSYVNVGRARTTGGELLAIAGTGRATVETGYAYTRSRDLDEDRALENIPAHRATLTLRFRDRIEGFEAYAGIVMTGHRPLYVDEMTTLTARRWDVRARIAKKFGTGLGGFLGVENLVNAGDAVNDRVAPRTMYAGIEVHR